MFDVLIEFLRAQPVLLLFTLLFLGYVIGRINVAGFTLGPVAGVLFAGIVFGHEGLRISKADQALGFALFIFSVGYQAGPRFFSALKADGFKYFAVSLVVALCAVTVAFCASRMLDMQPGVAAGLLAGGLTSSPTLAAAQDAVRDASITMPPGYLPDDIIGNIASAYAITYIFGLTGLITLIRYLPRWLGIDLEAECRALEHSPSDRRNPINITTRRYRVENAPFTDLPVKQLREKYGSLLPVATVLRNGKELTLGSQDFLQHGDLLELIAPRELFSTDVQEIGPEVPLDWDISEIQETRTVVVTNAAAYGKTLFELDIPKAFRAIVRKVLRQGVELPHHAQLELKKGDVLHVVGKKENLVSLGKFMGHIEADLRETDMLTFALGISAGVLIGLVSFHIAGVEIGLGNAGGLLTAGLVIGYMHSVRPTFGRLPEATGWWLMEFGLLLFMAGVGLQAGGSFIETLASSGPSLIVAGIAITVVPILVAYFIGARVLKLNPAILMGALTGAMTSGASLSVVTAEAKSAVPAIGYAGTYAFGNVLLMVAGPMMLLIG
ncbi:aspartate:alanine exchanger family transporter [Parahalioglobus pacificus]|uniref:aspartate:alanine exchanger family transporter n=1 Tax=Parahalioglobus pacificus TaxID=930806 RepID=UPI001676CABA|nr:TrkA C-terminal domain-containing protein [Halioglobus pacificus]